MMHTFAGRPIITPELHLVLERVRALRDASRDGNRAADLGLEELRLAGRRAPAPVERMLTLSARAVAIAGLVGVDVDVAEEVARG